MIERIPFSHRIVICLLLWLLGVIYFFANAGDVELHVTLESTTGDVAQTFYSRNAQWNETDSIKTTLNEGRNDLEISLPGLLIGDVVRFDPGQKPGVFRLTDVYWTVGATRIPVAFAAIVNAHPLASDLVSSDADARVVARDDDPQLNVPAPPLSVRLGAIGLPAMFALAGLLAIGFAIFRRVALPTVAVGVVACCGILYFYTCATLGPRLPLFDDWRYVLPGAFNITDGWAWLRAVGNDTYFLTNQLLDFTILKLSNVDFFALRLTAVAILMLQIVLQVRIVLRTTNDRPIVGAIAVAATMASLGAGAYWSNATIAYQQALPTLFGTLLLGFLVREDHARSGKLAAAGMLVCCLASGLAYISGGVLLASLGAAGLLCYTRRLPPLTRASLLVLCMGLLLFAVQFALVTQQQGSLLEHSHLAETVFPTDRRFWIFFVALFGRALGYNGTFIPLDALCTAIVLAPAAIMTARSLRKRPDDPHARPSWALLAMYAGIGAASYAAVVAYGRAGFAPSTADNTVFTLLGKHRFHFWPIAAMVPYAWLGWIACVERWPRDVARAVAVVSGIVLVAPKSMSLLDNASRQREMAAVEREGARCVVAHLHDAEAGRPVVCVAFTVGNNDLSSTLRRLRDQHSATYARLLDEGSTTDNPAQP